MLANWDRNEAGNVSLTPLLSWETARLQNIGIGLRLQVSSTPAEPHKAVENYQVAMSVEQAQELIALLQMQVDLLLLRRPDETPN